MNTLRGKTLFITGASRGIGKAIGLRAARDGANIVIVAKTTEPHPKLPGTIYTAAEEMEKAGGRALAVAADIKNDEQVQAAVDAAIQKFGGIDILVNNAGTIQLGGTLDLPMKKFDLLQAINTRGPFLCSKLCISHLKKAKNPHILNLSPPLKMEPKWFAQLGPYSISKYGMSMCVLGMSEEFREEGIAVNALWPKTTIATAAIYNVLGGEDLAARSRKPDIVADAAHIILTRNSRSCTGNFFLDEDLLKSEGITDFSHYAMKPGAELQPDFFI